MADTYTSAAKARLIEDATRSGTWGPTLNSEGLSLLDDYMGGVEAINLGTSTSYSLAALSNGTDSESRAAVLRFTGTPASAVTVTVPASVVDKYYRVENSTGQRLTIKYAASTGVVLGNLDKSRVWCDGSEVYDAGPGHRITAAEIAAGVTPTNYAIPSHDVIGEILPARYGFDAAALAATNVAAMEAAKDVAAELGGGIIRPHSGTFLWDDWTCDENNVLIDCAGRNATIFSCAAVSSAAFLFEISGTSIVRSGIRNCGFYKADTDTKTAVKFVDQRQCYFDHVAINSGNWPGSAAIGLHTTGRDFLEFQYSDLECARPWVIDVNPNLSGASEITLDMTSVHEVQFNTTVSTGKCVEVLGGATLYSLQFDTCDFAGGKYGFYSDDTTSGANSLHIGFTNVRFEQSADATGFDIYWASTARTLSNLNLDRVNASGSRGGLYLRNVEKIGLNSSRLTGGSGITNLDITFISTTELRLDGTLVQTASTNTLTNGVAVLQSPFATSVTALAPNSVYVYDQTALVSRRAQRHDGVLTFSYKGTMADDAQINLPILSSGGADVANFRVSMGASTGPVLEYAFGAWRPGTVALTGSTNTATTNSDGDLCVIDNTNALSVINRLGLEVDVVLNVIWSD
jgi:hypothetical protein